MHLRFTADKNGCPAGQPPDPGVIRRSGYYGLPALLTGVIMLASTLLCAGEGAIYLKAPGLRLQKDPSVVIPAEYVYANRPLHLPRYRDRAGNPLAGWSRKYIPTRRFKSDQSAWIYYRRQDLQNSIYLDRGGLSRADCIWPGGSLIVIESYQGNVPNPPEQPPVEIAVIAKANRNTPSSGKVFFAGEWSYARFTSRGDRLMDGAKVRECNQCHSIAFQLTGDLVFTRFP